MDTEQTENSALLGKSDGETLGTKLNVGHLVISNIVIFLLAVSTNIYSPVQAQYVYHRVADALFGVNNTEIKNFSVLAPCFQNTSDIGYRLVQEAQQQSADKQWQFRSCAAAVAVFSNIVLGSYSDIIGRKFLFLCPMLGHLLRNAITAVIIYWRLDINFFFLSSGIDGLLGGAWAILLAVMAYAADNTPPKASRSLSLVIIESVIGLSEAFASLGTGYFIQNTGFFYPSLTSAILTMLDMIIVFFCIKNNRPKPDDADDKTPSKLQGLIQMKNIYFGGTRLDRAVFWVGLFAFFLAALGVAGGSNIDTLFLMNLPFCWSPEKMGIYDTISTVVRKTIGVGLVGLFQICCTDSIIGLIGAVSDIGGNLWFAFATTDWMLYIGYPVTGMFGFTPTPMARALLSKQVPANRQGAIFASMAVIEAVCSIVATAVFNNVYSLTVAFWGGAVYAAYSCNNFFTAISFIVITVLLAKQRRRNAKTVEVN